MERNRLIFAFIRFAQHLPLVTGSPFFLFLFAYDGKISSCPSNPVRLSQPMKESICFSTFPTPRIYTNSRTEGKIGWKINTDWTQSSSCLNSPFRQKGYLLCTASPPNLNNAWVTLMGVFTGRKLYIKVNGKRDE